MSMSTDPPPPKSFASPPLADTVVRPFTSQGSTFVQPYGTQQLNRPSSAQDSHSDRASTKMGPYISASARTSYTRVDVDSLSSPAYPPLPPLPAAFAVPPPTDAAPDVTSIGDATSAAAALHRDTPSSTAQRSPPSEPAIPQTPQVALTFLLVSGRRKTQTFEPETTVGRVKELVWNAWPARDGDWQDERPPAPSYLRILYLGKILQDDDTLLRVGFPTSLPNAPNAIPTIVHLSIRPYGLPSDDPTLSKKKRLSVAITRRLSTTGVTINGGRNIEHEQGDGVRRAGCCTGCTIC